MEKEIYLDNSATTKVDTKVAEMMVEYMTENYGNPSSMHTLGQKAKFALDDAREKCANVINANYKDIYFTSGGTEADNWAIKGVVEYFLANKKQKKLHIITTKYEHSAILATCKSLQEKYKHHDFLEITYIAPDEKGYISPNKIKEAITENTILVSVMHVNNEIGTINDIAEIGKICHAKKITFHSDCVQSYAKLDIDVKKLNIDLLSASAHKIHGPKGVGFLYIKRKTPIMPIIHGGKQENKMRMGTENLPGIVGFGVAAEIANKNKDEVLKNISLLKQKLYSLLNENLTHFSVNGDLENGYPGILNLSFEFVEGESIALSLDMENISVSTGSACAAGAVEPSHVLLSIGLSKEQAQSSIRFSIGKYNTAEEIEYAAQKIIETIIRLRKLTGMEM